MRFQHGTCLQHANMYDVSMTYLGGRGPESQSEQEKGSEYEPQVQPVHPPLLQQQAQGQQAGPIHERAQV